MSVFAAARRKQARSSSSGRVVLRTEEFRRIEQLPRRAHFVDYAEALTELLKTPTGTMRLRVNQGWFLYEAGEGRGGVFIAPVGEGKTPVSVLLGAVWQVPWLLLIVPANAVGKTNKVDIPELRKHFVFPDVEVISYEMLARSERASWLDERQPPAIVCDEVHKIRRRNAVRRRLSRYLPAHPEVPFAGLSGTMMEESIRDFAHIFDFALGESSPLPRTSDIDTWAELLDEEINEEDRPDAGAFVRFCTQEELAEIEASPSGNIGARPVYRRAFQRLLSQTPGVVIVTNPTTINSSLIVREVVPTVPPRVREAIARMRQRWATPSDDVIMTGIEFARHAKELALGFYYRWKWPGGVPDQEWLEARKNWRAYVRWVIRYRSRGANAFDTEQQVKEAVEAGELTPDENQYEDWFRIANRWDIEKLKETVWVSDFMVDFGMQWMEQAEKRRASPEGKAARTGAGIVWVGHSALLEAFRARGARVYGGGDDGILTETESCVASIAAHREAKNLQHAFSQNLFLYVPKNAQAWEQSMGRTHRSGQKADEVTVEVALHVRELWEAFEAARARAAAQREALGPVPKLCYAQVETASADEVVLRARAQDPLWVKQLEWEAK
jgi:hypothetical protein